MSSAVLTQALLIPAEHTLHHMLRHAPLTRRKLQAHQGRVMAMDVADYGRISVRFLPDGPELGLSQPQDDTAPDAEVTLRGSLNAFLTLARADDKVSVLMKSDIEIDGDTDFALSVTRILQAADMDWESFITPLTGGLLAHQIGRGVRRFLRWGERTSDTLQQAGRDYLQDESEVIAAPLLQQEFSHNVDQLRLACDRLEARISQLEQRASNAPVNTVADHHHQPDQDQ